MRVKSVTWWMEFLILRKRKILGTRFQRKKRRKKIKKSTYLNLRRVYKTTERIKQDSSVDNSWEQSLDYKLCGRKIAPEAMIVTTKKFWWNDEGRTIYMEEVYSWTVGFLDLADFMIYYHCDVSNETLKKE